MNVFHQKILKKISIILRPFFIFSLLFLIMTHAYTVTNLENIVIKNINDVGALFPQTLEQADDIVRQAIERLTARKDVLLSIAPEERTFSNTVLAYDELNKIIETVMGSVCTISYAPRDASHWQKPYQDFRQAVIALSSDKRFYTAFCEYKEHHYAKEFATLSKEQQYYFEEQLDGFKRSGYDKNENAFAELTALRKEMSQISESFNTAINAAHPTIEVDEALLTGVDTDFIKAQKRNAENNHVILSYDYPTQSAIMSYCTNPQVREQFWEMSVSRAYPENIERLQQLLAKRKELATLLGYESYAAYSLSDAMVKTPHAAHNFLQELQIKVSPIAAEEMTTLFQCLPDDVVLVDGTIQPWDSSRLFSHYEKINFDIDQRVIAEYFPFHAALQGMFSIYEKFLGLSFEFTESVPGLWSDEVSGITVYNKDRTELIGFVLLDLFPRKGKYSHACHIGAMSRGLSESGNAQPAVSTVLANFPRPLSDKQPSLLRHYDVTTFFHEFGHAMHSLLAKTELSSFAGINVKGDFVELPSQMLEQWMYEEEMLQMVSCHYRTQEPLPHDLIERMKQADQFGKGSLTMGQVTYARISLEFHEDVVVEQIEQHYEAIAKECRPFTLRDTRSSRFLASFGHLSGYAASYYGYQYSRAYAQDVFAYIKAHGLLNPEVGKRYVECILQPGGSRDPMESLELFLERAPSIDAYVSYLQQSE